MMKHNTSLSFSRRIAADRTSLFSRGVWRIGAFALMAAFFIASAGVQNASGETVTYEVTSKSAVATSGTAPAGSSATYSSTYSTKYQLTAGNSMTLTLSGFDGCNITGLVLSMKSNSSKGAGNMSMTSGGTTLASIATANFSATSWHGSFTGSYVDVTPTVTSATIGAGNTLVITIAATINSLYCQSFTITYTPASTGEAPEFSPDSGSTTVTVGDDVELTVSARGTPAPTYSATCSPATDEYLFENDYLVFTPPTAGTYVFTITASNTQGSDTYTYTVTVNPAGTPSGWVLKGSFNGDTTWNENRPLMLDPNFGGGRYTSLTLAMTEGGSKEFKFMEPLSSIWVGAYGVATPSANTPYISSGGSWGGNFSMSVTSGRQYTFRSAFRTNEPYDYSQRLNDMIIFETTAAPVTLTEASDNHATAGPGAVTVTATLSGAKNTEESVYIRYTANGWTSSQTVLMTVNGTTATGTIPAQTAGTTIDYYLLTTTASKANLDTHPDLCTLNGLKSGATNFNYVVTAFPPTVTSPTSAGVTATGATLGATVTGNGGAAITDYGVVVGTSANPTTTSGTKIQKGTSLTTFGNAWTVPVSGLSGSTTYHYRGYAVNSAGTAYSADATFTTALPETPPGFNPDSGSTTVTLGDVVERTVAATGNPAPTYSATCSPANDEYYLDGDEFGFIPTTVGTYVFTITASNTQGSDTYTYTVVVNPTTPVITLGTVTAATVSYTLTGAESGATLIVRRFDSEAAAEAGTATSGGTLVQSSTATGGTDSGLASCSAYFYRAWAQVGSLVSAGSTVASKETVAPGTPAPTVGAQTASSFTLNWPAVPGAVSYLLDVATDDEFSVGAALATDLFISEYIEGSSNNKYIEIFNGTGASVDLSDYSLLLFANGSGTAGNTHNLSGTLANGETKVYKNSQAELALPSGVTAETSTACGFNGDDTVALKKKSTGAYVDIFGNIGEDPGTAWTSGTHSTLDKTLVRKSSVSGGVTVDPASGFPTLETEWNCYAKDTVSYLGAHSFSAAGGTSSYVDGYEQKPVSGLTETLTGLTVGTYYYRVRAVGSNGDCLGVYSPVGNVTLAMTVTAPTIATDAGATSVTASGATLGIGGVSMGNGISTAVTVEYGTTTSYGSSATPNPASFVSTETAGSSSATLTGLEPGTTYYYRWTVSNSAGSATKVGSFLTAAAAPTAGAPTVSGLSSSGATVTLGTIDMNGGASTAVTLEYGTSTSYGSSATPSPASFAASVTAGSSSAALTGLEPGTTYYYRWTVSNSAGTETKLGTFSTPAAAPTAGEPVVSGISVSGATVTLGTIDMNGGASTAVTLEYGTTTSYGSSATPSPASFAASVTAGSSSVTLTGLSAYTLYHYKWTIVNSGGTLTKTGSFTTLGIAPAWNSIPNQNVAVAATLSRTLTGDLAVAGTPAATFTLVSVSPTPAGTRAVTSAGAFTFTPAAADATKVFTFTFRASNVQGSADATMSVTVTSPNLVLQGSGTFGSETAGTSVTRTYTIQNSGTAPLTVSAVSVANTTGSAFSMPTAWSSQTIAAGSTATFVVQFAPAAEGNYAATLTLTSNDPDTPSTTLALTGVGASAACVEGVAVTYLQQTGNYNATQSSGSGGTFNSGTTEIGLWANGGGNNSVATFQTLSTTGNGNAGTARPLQVGDEYIITTFSANNPGGYYGISFNDSVTYGAYSDCWNARRMAWQLDSTGNYKIIYNNGSGGEAFTYSESQGAGTDRTLKVKITSSDTFTARIGDEVMWDRKMLGSPSASARVRSVALYVQNDNGNKYFKNASVLDTGAVEFGGGNGNPTIAGVISDGIPANCASGSRSNRLYKIETGTVTLTADNTFSGGVEVQAGTLAVGKDAALGAVPASLWGAVNIWSSGTLRATDTFTMNALRGIEIGTVNGATLSVDSAKTLTVAGRISGTAVWNKTGAGTLVLGGVNTFTNGAYISAGTLKAAGINALGGSTGGQFTFASGTTLELGAAAVSAQKVVMNAGSTLKVVGAGQRLTVAETSTIHNLTFDVTSVSDQVFDGTEEMSWTLVNGAAITFNGTLTVTKTAAQGNFAGLFKVVTTGTGLTVQYLPLAPPTSVSVAMGAAASATSMDLSWTPWEGCNVLIVRKAGGAPTWAPVSGTSYADGFACPDGSVVVKGSVAGPALTDTGLTPATGYFYYLYSEYYGQYSPGTLVNASTYPSATGGNDVHWRADGGQSSGAWEQANAWWYMPTSGVGFANGNMTDYGPNNVFIGNDNRTTMTLGTASTLNTLTFESTITALHTLGGSAALTVNGGIYNKDGLQHVLNVPLVTDADGMEVSTTGAALTLGGGVTGAGTLTKLGSKILNVSSALAHTGGTAVNGGEFRISTGGSLAGNATVASEALLTLNPAGAGDTLTYAGVISGAGNFKKMGNGRGVLTQPQTFTGEASVTDGTLELRAIGAAGATLPGDVALSVSTKLLFSRDGTYLSRTVDGIISGRGQLEVSGDQQLTLTAANTFSGATLLNNGAQLVVNGSLVNSAVSVDGGSVLYGVGMVSNLTLVSGRVAGGLVSFPEGGAPLNVSDDLVMSAGCGLDVAMPTSASWRQVNVGGTLSLPTSGTVTVNLSGAATGFSALSDYSWKLVDTTGGVDHFDPARFTVNATGFTPAPSATDGSFSVTVTDGDLYLNWHPRAGAPTMTPGAATATTIPVTLGNGPASPGVIVVCVKTGGEWATVASAYPATADCPAVGDSFDGGTVVYVGAEGSITISGLQACTAYDLRARSYRNGVWSTAADTAAPVETTSPAVPTGLTTSGIGPFAFTLNWPAVAGAADYRLDISTNEVFGGAGGNYATETFNNATFSGTAGSYTDKTATGGDLGTWEFTETRTDEVDIDGPAPCVRAGGVATSPELADGVSQVAFTYYWCYGESGTVDIELQINNTAVQTITLTGLAQDGTGTATFSNFTAVAGPATIKVVNKGSSNKRMLMDNIIITKASSPSYLTANGVTYSNLTVSGTSRLVDGLDEDTTYYYRLRSAGATCESESSETGSVTTTYDATMPDATIADLVTGQIAMGTVQNGTTGHVLQAAKVTVITAAASLAGVTVPLTGTAVATDVTNYKLWTSANADLSAGTLRATTAGSAVVWSEGAATLTLTPASAVSLGVGTHYVFVTVDTAAGAIGGHTLTAGAMTNANYSFTSTRKHGGASAAGEQTIVRAPAPAVDGATSVTWAAGTVHSANLTAGVGVWPTNVTWTWTVAGAAVNGSPNIIGNDTGATFSWSPTGNEIGRTCVFTLTALNDVGSASCTLSVTVGMGELSAFAVAPVEGNGSVLNMSWTPFDLNNDVVIRYSDVSLAAITGPTAGGTLAYDGAANASPQVLSGLTACKTYYFKAWERTGSTYSLTPQTAEAAPVEPAATTSLSATGLDFDRFTARWTAIPGATQYRLDVSTFPSFATSTEFVQGFEGGVEDTWSYGTLPSAATIVSTTNRSGRACLQLSSAATVTFAAVELAPTSAGQVTVAFSGKSVDSGDDLYLDVTTWDTAGVSTEENILLADGYSNGSFKFNETSDGNLKTISPNPYVHTLPLGATQAVVAVRSVGSYSSDYYYVDDLSIVASGERSCLTGYDNLTVAGTSQLVTGLNQETTYYFRVRGEGATADCVGPNVTTNVTTLEACPSPATVNATDGTFFDKIQVTWSSRADRGAEGYQVWRSATADVADAVKVADITGGTTLTWDDTDSTLVLGQTYWYWVRAVKSDVASRFTEPDAGHKGQILRYNGFEGDLATETWGLDPLTREETDLRPDAARGMSAASTNGIGGTYAMRILPGRTVVMDNTEIPAGTTQLSLSYLFAAGGNPDNAYSGPNANDNLKLGVSYDNGRTWTHTTICEGDGHLKQAFTVSNLTLEVAGHSQVQVAFFYDAQGSHSGSADAGYYWVDEVQLLGDATLPRIFFPQTITVVNGAFGGDSLLTNVTVSISASANASAELMIYGTATEGDDYLIDTTDVTFSAGGATSVDIPVTVLADVLPEGTEIIRLGLVSAVGALVGASPERVLILRDPDSLELMTASLAAGPERARLMQLARPDVVAMQDWTPAEGETYASFVSANFDAGYAHAENADSGLGIISRHPITATKGTLNLGSSGAVGYYAVINLPDGIATKDLNVFNVKFTEGATTAATNSRVAQVTALTNAIAALHLAGTINTNDNHNVIMGALNFTSREETGLVNLLANPFWQDLHQPTDLDGNKGTDLAGVEPHDFILTDRVFDRNFVGFYYEGNTYPNGMILDSREWGGHPLPALACDVTAEGTSHRPVLKLFTAGQVTQDPLLTLDSTNVTAISVPWTLVPNDDGDEWVVVFNTTGEFAMPAANADIPAVGTAFAGGTVMATGDGSVLLVSGVYTNLSACTPYFYQAYSKSVDGLFSPGADAYVQTLEPAAPTDLSSDDITSISFNAIWTEPADNGAMWYELDVSTNAFGGVFQDRLPISGSGDNIVYGVEDFSGTLESSLGWSSSTCYAADNNTTFRMGSGGADGKLITPIMDLLGLNGRAELTFDCWRYGSDVGSTVKVEQSIDGGTTYTTIYTTPVLGVASESFTVELENCTIRTRLRFTALKDKRAYIDNIRVQGGGGASECLPGYEHRPVTGGEYTVTGLVEQTQYYWRLRAHGGACDSEWVMPDPEFITTLGAPRIALLPSDLAFGRVAKDTTETLTVTVTNFGHANLNVTGVTFENAMGGSGADYFSVDPGILNNIAPGGTGTLTVSFTPRMGGSFSVNMLVANNTEDANPSTVRITGACYDPATSDPAIYEFGVVDGLGKTNTVWDHSLAFDDTQPVLSITAYHFTGLKTGADATWRLRGPDNELIGLGNYTFSAVESLTLDGRVCQRFTSPLPNLGEGNAALGQYKVEATFVSSNGCSVTNSGYFTPSETGWLMDDFRREDSLGSIGNGWVITTTNAIATEAAVADGRLEFYGPHTGSGGTNGYVGVYQDVSALPYSTTLSENDSTLSWAFHFRAGRSIGTFDKGSYAGAFVLGATAGDWCGSPADQQGYAVIFTNNTVQLARFSGNLLRNANITRLGSNFAFTAKSALAVRVNYVPAQGVTNTPEYTPALFRLYARVVGTNTAAFDQGSPMDGWSSEHLITTFIPEQADSAHMLDTLNLKYAGALWNHATAGNSADTAGVFDNFYFPHAAGQGVIMAFSAIDEDVTPPVHSAFNTRGAISYPDLPPTGLVVSGIVADVSGVFTGTSNTWTLYSNDVSFATGSFSATPAANGAATNVTLSATLARDLFAEAGFTNYVLEVTSTDYDVDRVEDSLSTSTRYHFSITDQHLATPTSFSVVADGEEMVIARWNNGGEWVVIVRSDEPIPEDAVPPQGVAVATGNQIAGLGTVLYVGNDSRMNANKDGSAELIVPPGATNYFRIFGTANNAFSASVAPSNYPCLTPAYEPGEVVDSFLYLTTVIPDETLLDQWSYATTFDAEGYAPRPPTGNDWSNGWEVSATDASLWKIHDAGLVVGDTGYPAPVGNKLYWNDTYDNGQIASKPATGVSMSRKLATPRTSGKIFVAFLMNYLYQGPNKYVSVSLMGGADGTNELVSFGKQGVNGWTTTAGIAVPGGIYEGCPDPAHYSLPLSGTGTAYDLLPGVGNDYVIVGEMDLDAHEFRMWAFAPNQPIPQVYTDSFDRVIAAYSNAAINAATVQQVTGIRIQAGSPAGACLGHVYFDEIRVGPTWDETLLFNEPEVYTYAYGEQYGVDEEGRPLFRVSDGALAHANVPLDVTFDLYHRTGIESAKFTILDPTQTNMVPLLADRLSLVPAPGALGGGQNPTWTNHFTSIAIDTNKIILGTNYTVEVELHALGGKENITTSAAEGGGKAATDLFFGEYGEHTRQNNYLEIYNGTGHAVDLSNYWIAMLANVSTEEEIMAKFTNTAKWSSVCVRITDGEIHNTDWSDFILPYKETVCIVSVDSDNYYIDALVESGRRVISMAGKVMNVSGDDPQLLMYGETLEDLVAQVEAGGGWLDMAGIAYPGRPDFENDGNGGRYIMYRLENAPLLPRRFPDMVDWNEWNYRDWSAADSNVLWTNMLSTAGIYDSKIGLGGEMFFTVFDDDVEPPQLGDDSGLMLGGTKLNPVPGETESIIVAWSFTNRNSGVNTARLPWPASLVTNASITWCPEYPVELVSTNGGTPGDFGSASQIARGELYITPSTYVDQETPMWIRFEMDLIKATQLMLVFDEAGGTAGFNTAQLQWSLTGGSDPAEWTSPVDWTWVPQTGGASTWSDRSFDLSAGGVPSNAGHLYLRVVLGPGYGTAAGTYRMDNIQICGYPEEFRITDAQLAASGITFRGNLYDTNSGLNVSSAQFRLGDKSFTQSAQLVDGGRGTNSTITWTGASLSPAEVTQWYEESLEGFPVRLSISDADDDRANDQASMVGNFGNLKVIDDDDQAPMVRMTTMRPVNGGTVARWNPPLKGQVSPVKTDASVVVGDLKLITLNGTASTPRFQQYEAEQNAWAMGHSGWHMSNKYWYATFEPTERDVVITNLSFRSKVHSVYSPTFVILQVVTDVGEGTCATNNIATFDLLPAGETAWTTNTLRTWFDINVPLSTLTLRTDTISEIRLLAQGASSKGLGAFWYIYDLHFRGRPGSTEGATEVVDAALADDSFPMEGSLWDADSGIYIPDETDDPKRPRFSIYTPGNRAIVENAPLDFSEGIENGGATEEAAGAFHNDIAVQLPYADRLLGEYTGNISAWDADADRSDDELQVQGDIAFTVIDNDLTAPSAVGTVRVNGMEVDTENPPDRTTAAWTNKPEFRITFDSAAVDVEPTEEEVPKAAQRGVSGIGEYRVAIENTPEAIAAARPYAVAVTNGALANYGFEIFDDANWSINGSGSRIVNSAGSSPSYIQEGTNCLRLGSKSASSAPCATQIIEFQNSNSRNVSVGGSFKVYRNAAQSKPKIVIEAFTDSSLTERVGTPVEVLVSEGTLQMWYTVTIPNNVVGNYEANCLRVMVTNTSTGLSFVDDIRLNVFIGEGNLPSMRYVPDASAQGLTTKYVFAVDADNNRPGDRMAGPTRPFYTAFDITRPTAVHMPNGGIGASSETVDDPTTQFDLSWTTTDVGPDDIEDPNHPFHGEAASAANRDLLSPWRSYKVYYGTFDPTLVPEGDPKGSENSYIATTFINTGAYTNWPSVMAHNEISDPSLPHGTTYATVGGGRDISQVGTSKMRLYDLDFDQDYVIVVVGVDKAGNEGPAAWNSWATNNTIRFSITKGWHVPRTQAESEFGISLTNSPLPVVAALAWRAAGVEASNAVTGEKIPDAYTSVSKNYDLIYRDTSSFNETSEGWHRTATVQTNWFVDDGGEGRSRGQLRLYRASYQNRWAKQNIYAQDGTTVIGETTPLSSEEVYALHNVVLSPGENFVALHGVPYTNTFEGAFGDTSVFPGGATALTSTRIEFFEPGTNALLGSSYWLNSNGRWMSSGGEDVTETLQNRDFFTRGFSITMPDPIPTEYVHTNAFDITNGVREAMIWAPVMQVPTNGFSQTIFCGQRGRGNRGVAVFNLAALRLPVRSHPSQWNLVDGTNKFIGGGPGDSDLIYTIDTVRKEVRSQHIYLDGSNTWRFVNGGLVPAGFFAPNDIVIIVSRNGGPDRSWIWTYNPTSFYNLPDRHMGE